MNELKTLHQLANEIFGIEIRTKKRFHIYIIARSCFFHYARNKTIFTSTKIGRYLGVDHATVLNSVDRYDHYKENFPKYKSMIEDWEEKVKSCYISPKSMGRMLSAWEIKIISLRKELEKTKAENIELERRMDPIEYEFPEAITKLMTSLSPMQLQEFIKYKVNPHMAMIHSQRNRLIAIN